MTTSKPGLVLSSESTTGMSDHFAVLTYTDLRPKMYYKPPHKTYRYNAANLRCGVNSVSLQPSSLLVTQAVIPSMRTGYFLRTKSKNLWINTSPVSLWTQSDACPGLHPWSIVSAERERGCTKRQSVKEQPRHGMLIGTSATMSKSWNTQLMTTTSPTSSVKAY